MTVTSHCLGIGHAADSGRLRESWASLTGNAQMSYLCRPAGFDKIRRSGATMCRNWVAEEGFL